MSLGAAFIVIVVIFFLIKSQGFRKAALVVLGLTLLGGVILYGYLENQQSETERRLAYAKTLIKTGQIEIIDPRVSFNSYDGSPNSITGRLRNNSAYAVQSVELHLRFQDCASEGSCETIGEDDEDLSVGVPPGQSRDFNSYLAGGRMSARGKLIWNYSIKSITADVP